MESRAVIIAVAGLLCLSALYGDAATIASGTAGGMERWGFVEVRPKAHLFWWYFKSAQRESTPEKPWPTILWLQGGPGGSGVGRGNFLEIGPLDVDLKPRNSTWLQKADLIFVVRQGDCFPFHLPDSPVGVGYSYAEDPSALAKTDLQVATDMTELLKAFVEEIPTLQSSPLYLVGESYGGKFAAMVGVSVAKAVRAGALNLTLGGVVLGDSWISPDDFAVSYPWLLQAMSRLDDNAVGKVIKMAMTVKKQIAAGQFAAAQKTWTDQLDLINSKSARVNIENIMIDNTMSSALLDSGERLSVASSSQAKLPSSNTISGIMNGIIKQKLKIIPKDIIWQDASVQVFDALSNDFMKPAINEVDELLSYGVNVTVYSGQLDIICSTLGTEAWVKRLKWEGLNNFLSLPRKSLHYCHPYYLTNAFVRSYKNLSFYWILGAGHMVPVDQPCTAVHMISSIVQSPAN